MALVAHVAGVPVSGTLAQTVAQPNGEGGAVNVGTALVRVVNEPVRSPYCEGESDCDRRPFVIDTNVLARVYSPTTMNAPVLTDDNAASFKSVSVKVEVATCRGPGSGGEDTGGWANRRIIDSGQKIIVPGPLARIGVLIPAAWLDLSRFANKGGIGPTLDNAQEVKLFARACKCECGLPPLPFLTWYRVYAGGEDTTKQTFVVPRGARRLMLAAAPAGITTIEWWQGDPALGSSLLLGTHAMIPAAVFAAPQELWVGAASHIVFSPANTGVPPPTILMRWEIGD
jgi:hypothetical protein